MQKTSVRLPEIKLLGIKTRTNNRDEIENWEKGKIFPCIQHYFGSSFSEKMPNRKKPGTTFCVFTDYESDHTGEYTYFIGEEVDSFENIPSDLEKLIIPPQTYTKFTNGPGSMPDVVREPWFKIWQMKSDEMGGDRCYTADFEVYDERASDHEKVILDIYIGIK